MKWWLKYEADLQLWVHVQPGAKRTEVVGLHGERLKLRISAAPTEGKANLELRRFLADAFGVPLGRVLVKSGTTGRSKQIHIAGVQREPDWFKQLTAVSST